MQTLMVLFERNTPNRHQILNTVKIIRKDGLCSGGDGRNASRGGKNRSLEVDRTGVSL